MSKRNSLILAFILVVSALLRLKTLPSLMVFTSDEAYQAYITQTLIKNFHIISIGLSAGGFDLYLGPFWNYILYPFLRFSRGDPVSMGFATSLLGIATTYLIYLVGKKMYSTKVGIVASLLYASLPLIVYYDQKSYPPGLPLLSLLILWSLYNLKFSSKWLVLFAFAYGLVFHAHLSLIPIGLVAVYWLFLHKNMLTRKIILFSAFVFLATVSPLIAFDYFHKGSNITTPIRIWKSAKEGGYKSPTPYHLSTLFDSLGRVWYLPSRKSNADEVLYQCGTYATSTRTKSHWFFSILAITIFTYWVFKKGIGSDEEKKLLLLFSLVLLLPFSFLSIINPVEYYLLGFFPVLFLMAASLVESLHSPARYLAYGLILAIAALGVFTIATAKGDYGIGTKKRLVGKVMHVIGGNPYDLAQEGDCHKYEGWRYVFSTYGRRPERSSEDEVYSWLYPDEVTSTSTKYQVVVKETRSPVQVDQNHKAALQEGGFTAYIYEH